MAKTLIENSEYDRAEITIKRITGNDIYKKLQSQDKILKEILAHANETNGRVTRLERYSIGWKIAQHPFKSILIGIIITLIVISDFRQPILEFLFKLI